MPIYIIISKLLYEYRILWGLASCYTGQVYGLPIIILYNIQVVGNINSKMLIINR